MFAIARLCCASVVSWMGKLPKRSLQVKNSPDNFHKPRRFQLGLHTAIMELFDIGPWVAISVLSGVFIIFILGVILFIQSAPPTKITLASGPEDSMFHRTAVKYQKALK